MPRLRRVHDLSCLLHRDIRHLFSAVVQRLQIPCQDVRLFSGFRPQQIKRPLCRIQPAACIHARPKNESDMVGADSILIHSRARDQRTKSGTMRPLQHLQAFLYENPVFVFQFHHVAHGSNRHIFDQIVQILRVAARGLPQGFHQFIGDGCPAQPFKWIFAPWLLWINDSICQRKQIVFPVLFFLEGHLMMIRHHNRHPKALSVSNLPSRRNAIVAGNDRIYSIPVCPFDQFDVQPIPILHAAGNIAVHFRSQLLQTLQQNVGGIHSVNIVISDDPDPLLLGNLLS